MKELGVYLGHDVYYLCLQHCAAVKAQLLEPYDTTFGLVHGRCKGEMTNTYK
jgi:hypothetical protein